MQPLCLSLGRAQGDLCSWESSSLTLPAAALTASVSTSFAIACAATIRSDDSSKALAAAATTTATVASTAAEHGWAAADIGTEQINGASAYAGTGGQGDNVDISGNSCTARHHFNDGCPRCSRCHGTDWGELDGDWFWLCHSNGGQSPSCTRRRSRRD